MWVVFSRENYRQELKTVLPSDGLAGGDALVMMDGWMGGDVVARVWVGGGGGRTNKEARKRENAEKTRNNTRSGRVGGDVAIRCFFLFHSGGVQGC